jgi:hypothetical protein
LIPPIEYIKAILAFSLYLIIEVSLERQLGGAFDASEAAAVEEGEVFEGADLVRRIDRFAASQATIFDVICAKHFIDNCT